MPRNSQDPFIARENDLLARAEAARLRRIAEEENARMDRLTGGPRVIPKPADIPNGNVAQDPPGV